MKDHYRAARRTPTWSPKGWRIALVLCLLAVLISVPIVEADEGPTQDEVNEVARKLYCPVCENTPLDVCPTQACQNWRDEIRVALTEGQSEKDILDEFALKYGDSVLAEPPARQWVAWALPVLFLLAAAAALAYWLRTWTRPAQAAVTVAEVEVLVDEADPYVKRLEEELAEWD